MRPNRICGSLLGLCLACVLVLSVVECSEEDVPLETVSELEASLLSRDPGRQAGAAEQMRFDTALTNRVVRLLVSRATQGHEERAAAFRAIRELGSLAVSALRGVLPDAETLIKAEILAALEVLGPSAAHATTEVWALLRSADEPLGIRILAARCLVAMGDGGVEKVFRFAARGGGVGQFYATSVLADLATVSGRSREALASLATTNTPGVRSAATIGLLRVGAPLAAHWPTVRADLETAPLSTRRRVLSLLLESHIDLSAVLPDLMHLRNMPRHPESEGEFLRDILADPTWTTTSMFRTASEVVEWELALERNDYARLFGRVRSPDAADALLDIAGSTAESALFRGAALASLDEGHAATTGIDVKLRRLLQQVGADPESSVAIAAVRAVRRLGLGGPLLQQTLGELRSSPSAELREEVELALASPSMMR